MKKEKDKNQQNRMPQDVNNTSRSMQPGRVTDSKTTSQNSASPPDMQGSGSITNIQNNQGRGWHGDSEGHARAGSRSHKNSGKKDK